MNFNRPSLRKPVRHVCALLALLALSLVVARPVCDAYAAGGGSVQPAHIEATAPSGHDHSHGDEPGPCCSSIDDASLLGSAAVAPAAAKPVAFLVASAVSLEPSWSVAGRLIRTEPPDRPPLFRPYHARTARLLI